MKLFFGIVCVLYLLYMLLVSKHALHMLQQNRYNRGYRYVKWIFRKYKENFMSYSALFLLFLIPLFYTLEVFYILGLFTLVLLFLLFQVIQETRGKKSKLPLQYTARIKRVFSTFFFVYLLSSLGMFLTFNEKNVSVYLCILSILAYGHLFILLVANFMNRPIEKMVGLYYKKNAIEKLNGMEHMDVIGVTGSYGKTSTKNVLYTLLDSKFNVFKTPENYNTPYGLMLSINNYLDPYNDYFIAEMGACKKGEIKELCDLVHPKYGVLTRIGVAHLETFGSEENIQRTKFELIENLPADGIGILNADDSKQVSYHVHNTCKILWIGITNTNCDCYAKDIQLSNKGTTFKVKLKGVKEEYVFETKLLGRANIYNILAGILLGYTLGISIKELQQAVKEIEPVEHRLSLSSYYGITLIDDAYNSNPLGAEMALEVLKMMPGKHIIVTPGMIEVGSKEEEVNRIFGKQIAESCDEVILIGEEKTKPIYEGLLESKYPKKKIHVLNDVLDAFPLLKELGEKETYVLLENDLPDVFNEIRSDKK